MRATWNRSRAFEGRSGGDRPNIALTGFMAAGKTVVGRKLARSLGWSFVDLDAVIEAHEGCVVREIFANHGEGYFRESEKAALEQVLQRSEQVVALGGGAVVDGDNLSLLKARSLLVWLKVSPQTVLRRVGRADVRPLLQGPNRLKRIQELAAQRDKIYAEAAVTVSTDGLTVEQVVHHIQQELCRP